MTRYSIVLVLLIVLVALCILARLEKTGATAMASDSPPVLLALKQPDTSPSHPSASQALYAPEGTAAKAFGNGPTVLDDTALIPSFPQSKLLLASLPMTPFVLDPLLLAVLSRDVAEDTPEEDPDREDEPSPDVAAITKSYMEEKIEALMELSGRYEVAPEILQREEEQEAVEALVIDTETGVFKNPLVELLPGVRIVSLAPLEKQPLLDSVIKRSHGILKSGEGEGEAEGEGEPDPFAMLDLQTDFVAFLSSFFEDYSSGMEDSFDFNAITVETIDDVEEILPSPNGIPDLAELLVLETFLKTPTLDFSLTGGPSHQSAVNRWQYFETLYGPVSDPALAPVYRVGLAYSCLDDFMSIYLGAALLSIATEVEVDFANLIDAMETTAYHFSPSGDIDGDQYSALIEWQQYGTGQTFAQAYAAYEAAVLNPSVYPSSITLHTVTRTCGSNVILLYPAQEKVADGVTLTQYATFGYDGALFAYDPYFDHWVITGESVVSPRYSGADTIEVLVEDDVTIQHVTVTPDLSVTVSFPDSALEAKVRTAINKPSGTLLLGDVYTPAFTELQATNAGIVSLEGLQHCRFLKSLSLGGNSIVTLTPLSTLYRLNELDLGRNQITDLSALANLHDLTDLELGIMFLSYLFNPSLVNNNRPASLAPLTSLLHLEYLGLTDTGLQGTALASFAASGSALDALPLLSIGKNPGLDLTPLASLDGLLGLIDHDSNLTNTVLAGLSGSSSLMMVYLFNNNLESLVSLSGCTDMLDVNVYNNPSFSVVPNTFPDMNAFTADKCALSDITNLGSLSLVSQLSLSDNDINDITPLLNITAFEENASIDLIDNPLAHAQSCAVITALRARGVAVQENAAQCRHTLTYSAGPNGSIAGTSPQIIYIGEDGTSVEAVPDWGYYFLAWSDDETDNPRTDTNVTEDITVTAIFAPYQYTLSYLAGDHGSIDGLTPQLVDHGEDGLPVTAVPDYGYHFTDWDDGRIDNPRIDTANTEPLTVYASFDINQYYLNYLAGPNGTIFGDSEQLVTHGDCGTAVEALPDTGYHFSHWSDGLANALRTDCGNTEPLAVTAEFYANTYPLTFDAQGGVSPVPPTKTITYNDNYGTLATTSRTGYIFSGWWTSTTLGKRVLSTTPVTNVDEHAIYAHWTARQYVVYLDCQGGAIPNPPSKVVTYDQPYGTLPIPTREGYTFDGWWTYSVGGNQIFPETIMTNTRYQHTLYAHWTQLSFLLAYLAEEHGSIEGDAEQTVLYGDCGAPVTAVPDTGYHFVLWSDLLPDNPRMDCYNTEPLTVTAGFAINQYTLAYAPGDYGTLSGNSYQVVNHGADGTGVQVIPDAGRTFVMWSDGVTANPRTDTEVTGDINVTAVISDPAQYTLNYVAGMYGTITGSAIQSVDYGEDGTPVTAVPDTGCYFIKWSDERTDNPRTDTDVTGPVSVTAVFGINQYTLNYAADTNGCIWGASSQTVNYGGNGSLVVAGADAGYHFTGWSDGWLNPGGYHYIRRDLNVHENRNAVASFAINHYALKYSGGDNGIIVGEPNQWIAHGSDGTVIEAVANEGYHFTEWSDGWRNALGEISATRQDTDVTQSKTVTAVFAINQYTLTYTSDAGTQLYGPTQQVVNHGEDAAPVIAVGIPGHTFTGWSDGVTDDVRIDQNVTSNIWVSVISTPVQLLWPPPTYTECSTIDPVLYTINEVYLNYLGTIYKYPDKDFYLPGESVRVCYEPAAGERFIEWFAGVEGYDQDDICPDARFMDTDWDTNCLEFDVSGNTWVMPIVDTDPYRTYMVHPPYPFMTYGETVPEGTFTDVYRKVVKIEAIANPGFEFTHWRAFPGGAYYENPLHVMLRNHNEEFIPGFADIRDGSSPPPPPSFTGTVILEGGSGEVFTSDAAPGSVVSHVEKSFCRAANFAANVEVGKNFFPAYWGWSEQGIDKCSVTSTTEIAAIIRPLSADTTFTLHLAERIRLNVLVEGEGMIPGYLPYTYNPKPYVNTFNVINANELTPDVFANGITLSPQAHIGWGFSHWEILRESGWWENVGSDNASGQLNIWMNWWADPMEPGRHVPLGQTFFHVKAVFEECEHGGTHSDGWLKWDTQLPQGIGYYHHLGTDPPGTDAYGCICYIHKKIKEVGEMWNTYVIGGSPLIGIGDISKLHGGLWPPHKTHQNGLNVDIRYVRSDGTSGPYNFNEDPSPYNNFDRVGTYVLIMYLISEGADTILLDPRTGIEQVPGLIVHKSGHHHHLHVQFPKP